MATTLNPTLQALRERIEERSKTTRAAYLNNLPQGPQNRTAVGCATLAHTTAIYPSTTKRVISLHNSPHLGIVTAYNDMFIVWVCLYPSSNQIICFQVTMSHHSAICFFI